MYRSFPGIVIASVRPNQYKMTNSDINKYIEQEFCHAFSGQ